MPVWQCFLCLDDEVIAAGFDLDTAAVQPEYPQKIDIITGQGRDPAEIGKFFPAEGERVEVAHLLSNLVGIPAQTGRSNPSATFTSPILA
mgnify:CR=1 FL=1